MSKEFHILIGSGVTERDREIFFGDNTGFVNDLEFIVIEDETIQFPNILKQLEIFKSSSDARRNGWDKEIPIGFSEHKIGSKSNLKKLFILKIITDGVAY